MAGNKNTHSGTIRSPAKASAPMPQAMSSVPQLVSGNQIIPARGVAGQALLVVIAIMTFLACLTLGGVDMVRQTAISWQSDISREVTVQIRPFDEVEMDEAIRSASLLLLSVEGIEKVTALNEDETIRLLEPWLGSGVQLKELPIPRLLVVKIAPGARIDLTRLSRQLRDQVPGASLDDHRSWVNRLATMARTTVLVGIIILLLVLAATVLTVIFATRAAMVGNRQIIDVLHFVGADGNFIAREFERHFLHLGLKGAFAGGICAIVVFVGLSLWSTQLTATPQGDQLNAMFGQLSLGFWGFVQIVSICLVIAILAVITSRMTVLRHVGQLETYGGSAAK